mgnify:CR=1 FL=1
MPQTRFVTKKALALGLKPIVVVNKVDKPGSRPDYVINAAFELFDKLGASEDQLDFPVVYASGLNGWASMEEGAPGEQWGRDLAPLFDTLAFTRHLEAVYQAMAERRLIEFKKEWFDIASDETPNGVPPSVKNA